MVQIFLRSYWKSFIRVWIIIYTDFKDELGDIDLVNVPTPQTGFSPYQYRKKVEAYIRANQDHVALT